MFKGSLPPRDKITVSDSIGGGNRPFTYPRFDGKVVLNMGDDFGIDLHTLIATGHPQPGQLSIHEITQAWQYHNNAASISYVGDAIWARVREDYGLFPVEGVDGGRLERGGVGASVPG